MQVLYTQTRRVSTTRVYIVIEHAAILSLASQTQPTPARIAFSITQSDPRWGWLGLACETTVVLYILYCPPADTDDLQATTLIYNGCTGPRKIQ